MSLWSSYTSGCGVPMVCNESAPQYYRHPLLAQGDDWLAVGCRLRWRNNRVSKATGMNLEHKEMDIMTGRFKLTLIPLGVLILLVSGAAIIGTVYTGTNASVTTPIKPRLEPIPVSTPSLQDEASFWLKPPGPARVQVDGDNALDDPQERPLQQAGFNIQARQAAQRELIELGFATIEGEQFRASIAKADDAGHGKLLLQAGFTEQQIRNAQERQRETSEEAEAEVWFQQQAPISALAELRRQGLADFQGNVNVAAADDAGFRDLLLYAGFTEGQIGNAQRQQR
jgi:hypothetical protein